MQDIKFVNIMNVGKLYLPGSFSFCMKKFIQKSKKPIKCWKDFSEMSDLIKRREFTQKTSYEYGETYDIFLFVTFLSFRKLIQE